MAEKREALDAAISECQRFLAEVSTDSGDIHLVACINQLVSRLQQIEVDPSITVELAGEVMRRMMRSTLKSARGQGDDFPIYPSGLRKLDDYIQGFAPGEIAIFAARPGIGKSILATRLADSFGQRGCPGALSWLEDGAPAFGRRAIAQRARVKATLLRQGRPGSIPEYLRAERIIEASAKWPIWLVTSDRQMDVRQLCGLVRRLAAEREIKWMIVDHLGEVKLHISDFDKRNYAIGDAIRAFRDACREVGVCPILFVQENRKREEKGYSNSQARLSYIADSSEIEKAARIVGFLSTNTEPEGSRLQSKFTIDISKNTNGPRGKVELDYYPEFMTVDDPQPITFEAVTNLNDFVKGKKT